MARSRRRDDDSGEYEIPRERTTRVKGGFALGFFGSIGCVCGLVFLFCVLPIGFLLSGGCAARQVAEHAAEQDQAQAQRQAVQFANEEADFDRKVKEFEAATAAHEEERKRMVGPLLVGEEVRVSSRERPHVSTTREGLDKLLTALVTKDELALVRIGEAGTSGRLELNAKCKVIALAGIYANISVVDSGKEWWVLANELAHISKKLPPIPTKPVKKEAVEPKKVTLPAIADPKVIANVKMWPTHASLEPATGKRSGEPCLHILFSVQPINGRKKYEMTDFAFKNAGEPIMASRSGEKFALLNPQVNGGYKDEATSEESHDFILTFESSPDLGDFVIVMVPCQLEGHRFENFSFTIQKNKIYRTKWDNRNR